MIGKMLKIYYTGLLGINEGLCTKDKKKKWRHLSMPFIMVYAFISLMFVYSLQIYQTKTMLEPLGMVPELLTLGVSGALMFCLFGSIAKSANLIFMSSDLDFWLSSPLTKRQVFMGKTLIAYSFEAIMSMFFLLPPVYFVGQYLQAGISFYLLGILGALILPVPVFIIGILLGMIVQVLFKGLGTKKSLWQIVIWGGASLAVVILSFLPATNLGADIWGRLVDFLSVNRGVQFLTQHYSALLIHSNVTRTVLYFSIQLILLGAAVEIGSRNYHALLNIFKQTGTSKKAIKADFAARSPLMALYKRELRRYFSSSIYVINTAFGVLMMIVAAIFLVIQREQALLFLPVIETELGISGMGMVPIILMVVMLVSMSPTTSSSISLEGKSFPLLKSFPVGAGIIFMAKVAVNLTLSFTGLIISLPLLLWVFPFTFAEAFFLIWLAMAYSLFSALLGLLANLKFPNFDWQAEVTVVKQSAAAMVGIFGNMLFVIGPALLGIAVFSLGSTQLLLGLGILVAILDGALLFLLKRFGSRWLMEAGD